MRRIPETEIRQIVNVGYSYINIIPNSNVKKIQSEWLQDVKGPELVYILLNHSAKISQEPEILIKNIDKDSN